MKIIFIWTTRPSNKLDFAKLGSFKILKVLGLVTYKLDLPDSIRIIRIRYILVLKPVDLEAPIIEDMPDINPENQEKVWEVKKILDIGLMNNS